MTRLRHGLSIAKLSSFGSASTDRCFCFCSACGTLAVRRRCSHFHRVTAERIEAASFVSFLVVAADASVPVKDSVPSE